MVEQLLPDKNKQCPCCGQQVTNYEWLNRRMFRLGAMEQRLMAILRRNPDGLPVENVRELLYGNSDGPTTNNIIAVMAAHINKKFASHGLPLRIKSSGCRIAIYRLTDA